jgi:glycine betaine/choline ABC-type transport system substrate-binding protein
MEKHNGWTNYATWRVNLEIIDGINFVKEDFVTDENTLTLSDLAEHLKSIAEDVVTEQDTLQGLAVDYALAFMSDVNWYEIAEALSESNPDLLK